MTYEATWNFEEIDSESPLQYDVASRTYTFQSFDFGLVDFGAADARTYVYTLNGYLADYPENQVDPGQANIEVQNPCILPSKFEMKQEFTGPMDYTYYTDDAPSVKAELENEKASPDVNAPTYLTYEPEYCSSRLTFSCQPPSSLSDCNYDDGKTITTFDRKTGTVTVQSYDKVLIPPGSLDFIVTAKLGINSIVFSHRFNLIDPCPNIDLTVVEPNIFFNKIYYLRDADYRFEWNDSNLVHRNTLVDCGALVV